MNALPFKRFIMFGAMRSGSNLLEKFINQYEGLVCHGELFHKSFIGVQGCQNYLGISMEARDDEPQRLLDAVRDENPRKVTGFRFFQDHHAPVMDAALKDPYCAKIILTRDPMESFVSLQIALETQQWVVSDIAHRKKLKIHFDLDAYEAYLTYRRAYYDHIFKSLATSEQPYFGIDYSMLSEVENINRLAAFLGDRHGKTKLDEPIKRQNPGALANKISNFEDLRAALDSLSLQDRPPPVLTSVLESGTDLVRAYFGPKSGLVFGPVPGVPDKGVRSWLENHYQSPPQNGFSSHRFTEWKALNTHPVLFTVVRHPVVRAYNAFMLKIFASHSDSDLSIREELENQFGMILPQGEIAPWHDRAALKQNGYGAEEHRICFKLFLIFVATNLESKTKIRQDSTWQLQTEIIRRYRILIPDVIVLKEETLKYGLKYMSNLLDISPMKDWKNDTDPAFSFPLSEIYDKEIETLTRKAYGQDYEDLGYENLS